MAQYSRTLNFRSNNLGKDSVFVLTFDDKGTPNLFDTTFPTALKVTAFGAIGPYKFTFTYNSDLGFTRAQISSRTDTMVPAATYTRISPGQKTILTRAGDPAIYSFSVPQAFQPPTQQMIALNSADRKETIGLGFFERPDREPAEMLVFDVGSGSSIQAEFTPILAAYVVSGYQQGSVLRGPIYSPILFQENLSQLEPVTDWLVGFNPGTGVYTITRDLSRRLVDDHVYNVTRDILPAMES